eukprot:COSAG04_NODE_4313_length_2163_cov_1.582849_1_plen_243_part_00
MKRTPAAAILFLAVAPASAPAAHGRVSSLMARGETPAGFRHPTPLLLGSESRASSRGAASCPRAAQDEIERTGRLSVITQGAAGNATGWREGPAEGPWLDPHALDPLAVDDSPPLRAALALGALCDGAEVYLPPGGYYLATTVRVPDGVSLVGGAGLRSHQQFLDTPQASLYGPVDGPALLFERVSGGNAMSNVMVHGQSSGVIIRNAACAPEPVTHPLHLTFPLPQPSHNRQAHPLHGRRG